MYNIPTSEGVYSEGEVAALLRPGEKGPLTRLSPAPAPAAAPAGPAGVAAVRLDTAELAGLVSERYSATCRRCDSNTWYFVGFSSRVSIWKHGRLGLNVQN